MAIEKKEQKSNVKVTFSISKEIGKPYSSASVVGDFNDWNAENGVMSKKKDGSFSVAINLERGKEYQFRYVLDGNVWLNDESADKTVPTNFSDANNSVVAL